MPETHIEVVETKDTVLDDSQVLCRQLEVPAGVLRVLRLAWAWRGRPAGLPEVFI